MSPREPETTKPADAALRERGDLRRPTLRSALLVEFDREAEGEAARRRGYTLDESAGGVCIQLDAPVEPGDVFRLELRSLDDEIARAEIARVVWCTARQGGRFNAGLEIVSEREAREGLLHVEHERHRQPVPVRSGRVRGEG